MIRLANLDNPVYDVILNVNTFQINPHFSFFGMPSIYFHLDLEHAPQALLDLFKTRYIKRISRLEAQLAGTEAENVRLRAGMESTLKYYGEKMGKMKRDLTPIVIGDKKSRVVEPGSVID